MKKIKIPYKEQYGHYRLQYYPVLSKNDSVKGKDWFDPDEEEQ